MKANTSAVFTLLVDNEFGVLTRITALIRRAGWNIRSLAVAETKTPEISRLTICLECRHHTLEQVLQRLGNLACVREISLYEPANQVARELALLHVTAEDETALQALCEKLGATVLEQDGAHVMLAAVCGEGELDAAMPELLAGGLVEIARTGAVSLRRYPHNEKEAAK